MGGRFVSPAAAVSGILKPDTDRLTCRSEPIPKHWHGTDDQKSPSEHKWFRCNESLLIQTSSLREFSLGVNAGSNPCRGAGLLFEQ
jgi:hypothetical protein